MKMFNMKKIFVLFMLFYVLEILLFATEVESTLSKRKKAKKVKGGSRPDGVAFNNKKFPTKCHVCRIMVEEINSSLKKDDSNLTEEQIKEKKRKERRKSKKEKRREKNMPILVAIEEVCDKMLDYVPQEEDKTKFRYIKTKDLKDTKSLIISQKENDDAAKVVEDSYDRYRHPETNRIMSMCDEILNEQENEILKWNSLETKDDLFDYLCRERVFKNEVGTTDDCLSEKTIKDSLWTRAFDAIFENRPELKNQEF